MRLREATILFGLLAAGCGGGDGGVYQSEGHSHERDGMMLVDAGAYHAGLKARISEETGSDLEIFFETADSDHKPVPLPLTGFTATAKTPDGGEHILEFVRINKRQRQTDPDGKCSHFISTAGFMEVDVTFTVIAVIEIDGKTERIEWKGFSPKKFAFVEE